MMSLVAHRRENCFRVLSIVYLEQKRCLCASKSTLFYGYVVYGCAEITLIFFKKRISHHLQGCVPLVWAVRHDLYHVD